MMIERKFKMLSTKEWIQYLQYKLSPEREKELEVEMTKDDFLNESLKVIGDKENRALAHQSISFLISEVQEYTGVSESKIIQIKEIRSMEPTAPVNWKLIGLIAGGLLLLGLLGYGIYYFLSSDANNVDQEQTMVEAESVSSIQSYADSSSMPMETIPTASAAASNSVDTIAASTMKKPLFKAKSLQTTTESVNSSDQVSSTSPSVNPTPSINSAASQKERDLFNQAQEIYKQGNREGAKKILRELKSYDNPMKSQAESILKNMEN
jgi:hypothetical protein